MFFIVFAHLRIFFCFICIRQCWESACHNFFFLFPLSLSLFVRIGNVNDFYIWLLLNVFRFDCLCFYVSVLVLLLLSFSIFYALYQWPIGIGLLYWIVKNVVNMLARRSNRDGMHPAAFYQLYVKITMESTKNCDNNNLIVSNKDEDQIICSVHLFWSAASQFLKATYQNEKCFYVSLLPFVYCWNWLFGNSCFWLSTSLLLFSFFKNNTHWKFKIWKRQLKSTPLSLFIKCLSVRFRCTLWIKVLALQKKKKTFVLSRPLN